MSKQPKRSDYIRCGEKATEYNEMVGGADLARVLARETDHQYACNIGVWYWQRGLKRMAVMAYQRSIELCPEPPTYFNLAVCLDDIGDKAGAQDAIGNFYNMVKDPSERKAAEGGLWQLGKSHLISRQST